MSGGAGAGAAGVDDEGVDVDVDEVEDEEMEAVAVAAAVAAAAAVASAWSRGGAGAGAGAGACDGSDTRGCDVDDVIVVGVLAGGTVNSTNSGPCPCPCGPLRCRCRSLAMRNARRVAGLGSGRGGMCTCCAMSNGMSRGNEVATSGSSRIRGPMSIPTFISISTSQVNCQTHT